MDISSILQKPEMDNINKFKNEEVQKFLDDIKLVDSQKLEILQELRKIVFETFPNIDEEIKYGGIVFLLDNYLFSGIFLRKAHISLEFVRGSEMDDPEKTLEGKGKLRRHLKFKCLADIKGKNTHFFVKQSL